MDLFKDENKTLESAEETLAQQDWTDAAAAREAFEALTGAYEKLVRQYRRLVRLSDRTGDKLQEANQKVKEQNAEIHEAYEQLKEAQAEIVRAEKLAALGGLVAGVAHEINTPLGVMRTAASALQGQTRNLREKAEQGQARKSDVFQYFDRANETVDLIESNAQRAADLIGSFKSVAVDRTADDRRRFELAPYLDDILRSLQPELRKTPVAVSFDCDGAIALDSYPGAFSQLVTNLVMNAIKHGFDNGNADGGEVRLTARQRDDDTLQLTVADTGGGVPDALRKTMFDPFVTTKRGQGGSGLGLHIVHNLVTARLGGTIQYRETEGGGATFEMTIPLAAPAAANKETTHG
jgi:two-component system NtrC family sensor kinase